MWDREFLWLPLGVWAIIIVVVGLFVGLLAMAVVNEKDRIAASRPLDTDHMILATEISRLHDDVRLLQTQVGPKQ